MTVREALPTMTVRGHSSVCHAEPPIVIPSAARNLRCPFEGSPFFRRPRCVHDVRFFGVRASE